MNRAPAPLIDASRRRRLVLWGRRGLCWSASRRSASSSSGRPWSSSAAEDALSPPRPRRGPRRLDRYLARHPDDAHALFLAAQAARRADAYADAERFLTAFEETAGPTDASKLEWVLLGVQQGDFAGHEQRLRTDAGRNTPDAPAILEALAKGYIAAYRWPDAARRPRPAPDARARTTPSPSPCAAASPTASADRTTRRRTSAGRSSSTPDNPAARRAGRPPDPPRLHPRGGAALRVGATGPAGRPRGAARTGPGARRRRGPRTAPSGGSTSCSPRTRTTPTPSSSAAGWSCGSKRPAEAEPFLARAVRAAPWHRDAHRLHLVASRTWAAPRRSARCEARIAELTAEDGVGGRLKLRARDNPGDVAVRWELWQWSRRNGLTRRGGRLADGGPAGRAETPAGATRRWPSISRRPGQPRRAALHRDDRPKSDRVRE